MICYFAWDKGTNACNKCFEEYGEGLNIHKLIEKVGLTVETVAKDNISGNMRYFSEYYSNRNKILLYKESIKKWAHANKFKYDDAVELILSHEFYHYLECNKIGLTSRDFVFPTLKIGKLVLIKSGVRALSEIGAHGFSRTYFERVGKIDANMSSTPLLQNCAINGDMFKGKQLTDKIFLRNKGK